MKTIRINSSGWTHRLIICLGEDCLSLIEPGFSGDSVRRVHFDAVSDVFFWNTIPWDRLFLVGLLLGLPGALMVLLGEIEEVTITGMVVLAVATLLGLRYLVCGRTSVQINRRNRTRKVSFICSPGRTARFKQALVDRIRQVQQADSPPIAISPEPAIDSQSF